MSNVVNNTNNICQKVCPICDEEYTSKIVGSCGHSMCLNCTFKYYNTLSRNSRNVRYNCPMCRQLWYSGNTSDVKLPPLYRYIQSYRESGYRNRNMGVVIQNNVDEVFTQLCPTPATNSLNGVISFDEDF